MTTLFLFDGAKYFAMVNDLRLSSLSSVKCVVSQRSVRPLQRSSQAFWSEKLRCPSSRQATVSSDIR